MSDLYRKTSLEKISDPEQLDQTVRITSPGSWLALAGVLLIIAALVLWAVFGKIPVTLSVSGILTSADHTGVVFAQSSGTLKEVSAAPGQRISSGEAVATLELFEGGTEKIYAEQTGIITACLAEEGDPVIGGQELFRLTPDGYGKKVAVLYVPLAGSGQLEKGMKVLVEPLNVDSGQYGHMEAFVENVDPYPVTEGNLWYVLGNGNGMAQQLLSGGPVVSVICSLREDRASANGFYWTGQNGKDLELPAQSLLSCKIIVSEERPITRAIHPVR